MVILANTSKTLSTQHSSESFKSVEFDDNLVLGFKIDDYSPLAYKIANKISSIKHLGEKKRLLYVALTRAKNYLIISKDKKENVSYKNSFLEWIEQIDIETIKLEEAKKQQKELSYKTVSKISKFNFESAALPTFSIQTQIGTTIHKIIELCYDEFDEKRIENIIFEYGLNKHQQKIKQAINHFIHSSIYKELKKANEIYFEFKIEDKRIDLLYKLNNQWMVVDFKTGDQRDYSNQLNEYKQLLLRNGFDNVCTKILYI